MELAKEFVSQDEDRILIQNFKEIASQTSRLLATGGVKVKAYKDQLPYFSALDFAKKKEVLEKITFYHDLCAEQVSEGYSLKDTPSFTWRALKKLGLTPTSNLFSQIKDEDVIEVYSAENVQLFRNFRYFEFCSYTLEEIYCLEWWNLYERGNDIMPGFAEFISGILKGTYPQGAEPGFESHVVKEAQSEEKLVMDYFLRWVGPVSADKKIAGFIVLEEASLHSN